MQLLSPQKVKKEKNKSDTEKTLRMEGLRLEESKTITSLNNLKDELRILEEHAEGKKATIDNDVVKYRNEAENQKFNLLNEITDLKFQRAELMKPIDSVGEEAAELLERAKNVQIYVDTSNRESEVLKEYLMDKVEETRDRMANVEEVERSIADRKHHLAGEEKRLKESETKLAEQWVKFHEDVNKANSDILINKKEVEDQRKANESILESNKQESERLAQERIAIKDTYQAIEKAKGHLGIKL